mmetsp:Transcript_40851/g.95379  ORF Transcript_40851/g.95379 Transcript_40851/m.95379 type:complete len:375 (-) Transcript_40851:511-1635(-)
MKNRIKRRGHPCNTLRNPAALGRLSLFDLPQHDRCVPRQEAGVIVVELISDILLPSIVIRLLLLGQVHRQKQVGPHVMVFLDVLVKATTLCVEGKPVEATDKAIVLHIIFLCCLDRAQLTEGIDDDSEDDVEQHGHHDHPESEGEDEPHCELEDVVWPNRVNDAANVSRAKTLINRAHPAHKQVGTHFHIFVGVIVQNKRVLEKIEPDDGVQVDDDEAEQGRHKNGPAVERHRLEYGLQIVTLVDEIEQVNSKPEGAHHETEARRDEEDGEKDELWIGQHIVRRAHKEQDLPLALGFHKLPHLCIREPCCAVPSLCDSQWPVLCGIDHEDDHAREALQTSHEPSRVLEDDIEPACLVARGAREANHQYDVLKGG